MSLKSLLSKIFVAPIVTAWRWLKPDRALPLLRKIISLADEAYPVVELIAHLTPSTRDDAILAALKTLGLTTRQIIESTDDLFRNEARLSLAAETLRERLRLQVLRLRQGEKLQVGELVLATVDDVARLDRNQLKAAAQAAFVVWKELQGGK